MRNNESLKDTYNAAYSEGKLYSGEKDSFFTFPTADVTEFILRNVDFKDKDVLEVGCGTGETAYAIAMAGARSVLAIDYSEEAIKGCNARYHHPNLNYLVSSYDAIRNDFDVVVLQEVIEHLDEPEAAILSLMEKTRPSGKLVVTCPNFTNLRGYIWMTLQLLFQVPMSLSDIHFFSPFDFLDVAKKHQLSLEWTTFAHDRVYGEKLIVDMRKRLTNAIRDAGMDNSKVEDLMRWLEQVIRIDTVATEYNGGKGFYIFSHHQRNISAPL
jgi:2-polyprenyl-3-methyl-5-hydroxy-6-metoxy-1,4-benzoquinol methylase